MNKSVTDKKIITDKQLNKEQLDAITYKNGPLLIVAGAGTGKTTVITERIKYLISENLAEPSQILALTFTEKASQEMIERVDQTLPYGYTQMWISTFHAFCDRILRDEALQIGLSPKFKLLTSAETIQFIKNNLFEFDLDYFRPLGNPAKFIGGLVQHFSRLQDEAITPNAYLEWTLQKGKEVNKDNEEELLEFKKWEELAKSYVKYEELKIKESFFDYGDLITKVLSLFQERPNVLKKYQDKFKYVLVDEFQDTNVAQYDLIKILTSENKTELMSVGDDSQCLPGSAKIALFKGSKRISEVKSGDMVLTAVGKGHTSLSKVNKVFKRERAVRLITLKTDDGKIITVTDNHKMFCFMPSNAGFKDRYYVYLMYQQNMGWRIGITNDLSARLRIEHHADKILGLASYDTENEVRFYESYYSAKYGIPTVPFTPRLNQAISGDYLHRLFRDLNTHLGAERLAKDLGFELNSPQFMIDAVTRGVSQRIKINLIMCYRNYVSKGNIAGFVGNPSVLHQVRIETSNINVLEKIEKAGYKLSLAKKGKKFSRSTTSLFEAMELAQNLADLTGGLVDKKFVVGKYNTQSLPSRIVPASHILVGMFIPVLEGKTIIYKRVSERKEKFKKLNTFDLEIDKTHNFIANGIVVHNSIYKFRGAAFSNILQLKDDYKDTKIIILNKNYRSTQRILDASHKLIKQNDPNTLESKLGIDKSLISQVNPKGEEIEFLHLDRVEQEADAVVGKIEELSSKYDYRDFAILVRANNHAEPFIRALTYHGIPHQFLGPAKLFKQIEIIDLISYLKVIVNFEDSISFYRLLASDFINISGRDLVTISNLAKKENKSLFEVCEELEKLEEVKVTADSKEKVTKLVGIIAKHIEEAKKLSAGQIIYNFLQELDLLSSLVSPTNQEQEKKALNITAFLEKLRSYEVDHMDSSVNAVVDWIDLLTDMGESPLAGDTDWNANNVVNILTVHGSKGLEFPVVFLVNLVSQRFPSMQRSEQIPIPEELIKETLPTGDYHLQEERRLFYVGMTRAKERLFLTAANYYGEGKRDKKLSPFIYEAMGEQTLKIKSKSDKDTATKNSKDILGYAKQAEREEQQQKDDYIKTKLKVNYLSYSQIETFKTCSLHYKLSYIVKIPTPVSAAQSFGISIHAAMKQFYQTISISDSNIKGSTKKLESLIHKCLEENWVKQGYENKKYEAQMFDRGRKYLSGFLEKGFDKNQLPILMEEKFTVPLDNTLKIGGVMDRVDKHPDRTIEIIDYKTSEKVPTQKEVDKNDQLNFYALAASRIAHEPFGKDIKNIKLSLYFFETQEKFSVTKIVGDLERAKKEIFKVRDEIEASDFECSGSFFCGDCDFKMFCNSD